MLAIQSPRISLRLIKRIAASDLPEQGWLKSAVATHPHSKDRIAVIDQPSLYFRNHAGEFLGIGFALAQFIGVPVTMFFIALQSALLVSDPAFLYAIIVSPFVIYSVLTMATFGIAVARARFALIVEESTPFNTIRLSLGAAVGVFVGFVSIPVIGEAYLGVQLIPLPAGTESYFHWGLRLPILSAIALHGLILAVYLLMFFALFRWTRQTTDVWLPIVVSVDKRVSARLLSVCLLFMSALALCLVPASVLWLDFLTKALMTLLVPELIMNWLPMPFFLFLANPLNAAAIATAGVIPLAAAMVFWRSRRRLAPWAVLAPFHENTLPSFDRPALHPIRAIAIGATAGLLAVALFPSPETESVQRLAIQQRFELLADLKLIGIMPLEAWAWFIWNIALVGAISGVAMLVMAAACHFMGTAHAIVSGGVALSIAIAFARLDWDWLLIPLGFSMAFFVAVPFLALISATRAVLTTQIITRKAGTSLARKVR